MTAREFYDLVKAKLAKRGLEHLLLPYDDKAEPVQPDKAQTITIVMPLRSQKQEKPEND